MKKIFLAVLIAALASLSILAQDKKTDNKSDMKHGDMKHDHGDMSAMPPMAKPAPEMTKLIKMLSGSWTTDEKVEPGPMAPNGATGKGSATFKAGPGGMSLIEDYNSPHGSMGPFHGHGVTWWDAKSGTYKGTWCDSMTPDCMIGAMKWDGDKLVGIPQEVDMGGHKAVMTSSYTDFKPDSVTYLMGWGPTAEQAKTGMTIVYKKAGAKAATPAAKKDEAAPAKK